VRNLIESKFLILLRDCSTTHALCSADLLEVNFSSARTDQIESKLDRVPSSDHYLKNYLESHRINLKYWLKKYKFQFQFLNLNFFLNIRSLKFLFKKKRISFSLSLRKILIVNFKNLYFNNCKKNFCLRLNILTS